MFRSFRNVPTYFSVNVPHGNQLSVALTPILGDPNLFVATRFGDLGAAIERLPGTCSGMAGAIISWCSVLHDSELSETHDQVAIPSADACNDLAGCELFIGVASDGFTKASVVATVGATPISLRDGQPQQGQLQAGGSLQYKLQLSADSTADLAIVLSTSIVNGNACHLGNCSPQLYVQFNSPASATGYSWHGSALTTGTSRVFIQRSDISFCPACVVYIRVVSDASALFTRFTITALADERHTMLLDGFSVTEVCVSLRVCVYAYVRLCVCASVRLCVCVVCIGRGLR